jgi:hypothetical protein
VLFEDNKVMVYHIWLLLFWFAVLKNILRSVFNFNLKLVEVTSS